ncbi:MAG: hypothetical protein ACTIJ6_10960 [Leucobacter sp.]
MSRQANRRTRTVLSALAASVLLTGTLAWASPARAVTESPKIELSADGIVWASNLADPLFDSETRWVPGDSRTATFFVRNLGGTDAWLSLKAERLSSARPLPEDDIVLATRASDGAWENLGGTPAKKLALTESDSAATEVTVQAQVPWRAGNDTQLDDARFNITVNLAEAVDVPNAPESPDGGLALSGSEPFTGWWIAAGATGIGAAFVIDPLRRKFTTSRVRGASAGES